MSKRPHRYFCVATRAAMRPPGKAQGARYVRIVRATNHAVGRDGPLPRIVNRPRSSPGTPTVSGAGVSASRATDGFGRRSAGRLLLTIYLILAALLLAAVVYVGVILPHSNEPDETRTGPRSLNMARAADVLGVEVREMEQSLTGALLPGTEETLYQLFSTLAEASQLELLGTRFVPLPRDGLVQPVAVSINLDGSYYDLPIFIDGIYRQSRVVELRSLTLDRSGPFSSRISARIDATFFRPVQPPTELLENLASRLELEPTDKTFARLALTEAARLLAMEAFRRRLPQLSRDSMSNHDLVIHSIPALIRKLPESPMDWLSADFSGDEVTVDLETDEPGSRSPDP